MYTTHTVRFRSSLRRSSSTLRQPLPSWATRQGQREREREEFVRWQCESPESVWDLMKVALFPSVLHWFRSLSPSEWLDVHKFSNEASYQASLVLRSTKDRHVEAPVPPTLPPPTTECAKPTRDPLTVAEVVVSSLEACGLPVAIGGALCLNTWCVPRATIDVDLNVFLTPTPEHTQRVLDCITRIEGYEGPRTIEEVKAQNADFMRFSVDGVKVESFFLVIDWLKKAQQRVQRVKGLSLSSNCSMTGPKNEPISKSYSLFSITKISPLMYNSSVTALQRWSAQMIQG